MPGSASSPKRQGKNPEGTSKVGGGGRRPRRRSGRPRSRRRRMPSVTETSAGGLVLDRAEGATHAALIGRIDRRGRLEWVLPKGHIEDGETLEETAVREVEEETGLHARVLEPLGPIDYWFVADGKRIHKTVHHYVLESVGGALSTADSEVSEVAWIPLTELRGRLRYPSERKLIDGLPERFGDVTGPA